MKLVHLSYTAILLASPALALFAQYSQNTNGINWMGEHDISNTTCFNLGNGEKFPRNMKIDSNPGDIAAAKYCMYMSTGENCLCDTQTYEFDLTKNGNWTGNKNLPLGLWSSMRFLKESCADTIIAPRPGE